MPRPAARRPSTPADVPATPAPPAASLAPAPDNGVPFPDRVRTAERPAPIKRRGKQLGARIPEALYERLVACADETRIPQNRLLERALDAELRSHGY